jgi:hypothetical protein
MLLTMASNSLDTTANYSLMPYIANFSIHNMNKAEPKNLIPNQLLKHFYD